MAKNAKLIIEEMATSELIPYIGNAKMHPEEQIAKIASSIKEYGFNDPIAIDEENGIIEGHGRLLAAQLLLMRKVPVIRLGHLSPVQRKAYIIAHNKLTLDTTFDSDVLRLELEKLQEVDYDLSMTGFDEDEIDEIMEGLNSEVEDPFQKQAPAAKELPSGDFNEFTHQCPKCGFEWDDKK